MAKQGPEARQAATWAVVEVHNVAQLVQHHGQQVLQPQQHTASVAED